VEKGVLPAWENTHPHAFCVCVGMIRLTGESLGCVGMIGVTGSGEERSRTHRRGAKDARTREGGPITSVKARAWTEGRKGFLSRHDRPFYHDIYCM
jgi:hypothetical protein